MKKKAKKQKPKKAKKKITKKTLHRISRKRKSTNKRMRKGKKVNKKVSKRSSGKVKVMQEQINALLKKGEERGFVTSSEILHFIPNIENSVEELEKTYDVLKEKGIELREPREFLELNPSFRHLQQSIHIPL